MKKYNVFKVIGISILISIVLSFLVPSTTFDSYGKASTGNINPVSFIDTFSNGITSLSVFLNTFIYILSIGVLYFVLNKTGKYKEIVNNTAYKFKDKKNVFVILSILMFGIVTAIIGDMIPMLVFVPMFIDILRKLGYNKYMSILTTIGSIIFGSTGSLYTNYTNQILQATVSDNIYFKILLLVLTLGSLIIFSLFFSKKPEETKLEKINTTTGKSISILFDVILLFIIIGFTPWSSYFGFDGFTDFHKTVTDFKLFNVSLFNALISSNITAFGQWTLFSLSAIVLIVSLIISLIYKFKFDDLLETLAESIKKTLPYALIVVLANVVLVNVYNSGFFYTILVNLFNLSDKLFSGVIASLLSAFVYPDYMYATQFSLSTISATLGSTSKFLIVLAVVFQAVYSAFLLLVPTSVLVLLGLRFTNGTYKEWFKYIFKYFMVVFSIMLIMLMILGSKYIDVLSIILLVIVILIAIISIILLKNKNEVIAIKEEKKEEKVEVKNEKIEKPAVKKTTTTKTTKKTNSKTTTKKSTSKASTKKKNTK